MDKKNTKSIYDKFTLWLKDTSDIDDYVLDKKLLKSKISECWFTRIFYEFIDTQSMKDWTISDWVISDWTISATNDIYSKFTLWYKQEFGTKRTPPTQEFLQSKIVTYRENMVNIPKPTTITEEPTTITENPTTITETPTTITEEPTTITEEPTTIFD